MSNTIAHHAKNLSSFSLPEIIQNIAYEDLLKESIDELNGIVPLVFDANFQPILVEAELVETESGLEFRIPADNHIGLYYTALESEPLVRLLQADAYRRKHWMNVINQMAISLMPAYATGTMLDHYALGDGVERLLIVPEDKTTTPPTPAVWEEDDSFRSRWFLYQEARSAGAEGWYLYHALSADPLVKDALTMSPNPRGVVITILSREGNGTASPALIDKVEAIIKEKYTEVMTDEIRVQSAEVNNYSITADMTYYAGSSNETVNTAIETEFLAYKLRTERIGHVIDESNIYDFLRQHGVYQAVITSPDLPIDNNQFQASFCTELTLNNRGTHGLL